jgi:hypothetical protein
MALLLHPTAVIPRVNRSEIVLFPMAAVGNRQCRRPQVVVVHSPPVKEINVPTLAIRAPNIGSGHCPSKKARLRNASVLATHSLDRAPLFF